MPERVAIIGAGVSGLVATKHALEYGFVPTTFERRDGIGGLWYYSDDPKVRSVSNSTTTLTSKELFALSDFPPPDQLSTFLHHSDVLAYLKSYADHFKLTDRIQLNTEVTAIRRADDWQESGHWLVTFVDGTTGSLHTEKFDAIVMATGMYAKPARPFEFRMEQEFSGQISHAGQVKSVAGFKDQVVVLVGFGNSAVQLATDLAPVAKQVYLSTRRGSWLVPTLNARGRPWDEAYATRFGSWIRQFTPRAVRTLIWESFLNSRFDHVAHGIQPDHHFLAANKTFAKHGITDYLADGRVKIVKELLSFTDSGVEFIDHTSVSQVDHVIFCTGYAFDSSIVEEGKLVFVRENDFHLYQHMYLPELNDIADHNNFAYLGHVQPSGSFFAVVEMQARFFFDVLSEKTELPPPLIMKSKLEAKRCEMSLNYVKTRRHTQIEDYTTYTDDLAGQIGALPSIITLLRQNPRLALQYVFGPALPYHYRLEGEHAWPDAAAAISTSRQRMNPRGESRMPSPCLILGILLLVFYLWLHHW